jgi:4-diphosphocytidyl-2-C-methyl-D-erythritol kinase
MTESIRPTAATSGGGPTCFDIFVDDAPAARAAAALAAMHPRWWVVATALVGGDVVRAERLS